MSKDFLRVGIVADDKTAKGTKSAKKNISSLERSVSKLGKTFVSVFAAQKLIQYTKLSAKAAAADQASAVKLANSLKNLGLQYSAPYVEDYISKLEQQSKIADDELRPAFQTLITQTSDLALSQKLLSTALNVSRGSGESLSTVVNDLSQAYVGNTKGLKKYYLGLTNAELAAASFSDVQKLLNNQFAGANQAYLNTYQGQIDTLSLAFGNLQESAGRAFFTLIGGTGGSAGGADKAAGFLDYVSRGLEIASQSISDFFVRQTMSQNAFDAYVAKRNAPAAPVLGKELFRTSSSNNAAFLKLEKDRQALIKKQLDAQKKLSAEQKKQAALKKAGSIFDMEQIQLIAALKGNISEEERKRLELQLALEQGNVDEAKKLTYELAIAQGLGVKIAQDLASLPAASNPFAAWKGYLDAIELQAKRIASFGGGTPSPSPSGNVPNMPIASPDAVLAQASADFAAANQQIKVIVEGGDEVTSLMRFKIQEAAQSGSTTNWSQTVGAWDR